MADDLVQGACVRALAAAESWTPGTRFDAWAFRILRNYWIDTVRRQNVEGPTEDSEEGLQVIGDDGEAQVMSRLELDEVCRAIDLLPPEQQEVLLFVCSDDMTYRQAAGVLGVPVGTVMSRLARARKRLLEMTAVA